MNELLSEGKRKNLGKKKLTEEKKLNFRLLMRF